MKWLNKFQEGGEMLPQQGDPMQQLAELVQAAMQGVPEAQQQIEQIMQAALQGDQQALQIAQAIQQIAQDMQGGQPAAPAEAAQMAKCGAKLKAKKGEDGIKVPHGKSVTLQKETTTVFAQGKKIKKAKAGCPCKLHRVGGRIVEVDCNGNIVK